MEQIKDYDKFFRQLSKFKKDNPPIFTNFYQFGSKLKNGIAQGKLFLERHENGFYIFEGEGEYFQFYYCIKAKTDLFMERIDRDCASWLIYNERTDKEDIRKQREKLLQAGFEYVVKNYQYVVDISQQNDAVCNRFSYLRRQAEEKGIELRFMEPDDYEDVYALWRLSFDSYRIPDIRRELEKISNDRRVILAYQKALDENGNINGIKIIGTTFMDFQGKTMHTHKTCVHPKCRGLGLGKLLKLASISEALKRGCTRYLVEIDEGNTASERMNFGSTGERQKKTGVITEVFVRRFQAS